MTDEGQENFEPYVTFPSPKPSTPLAPPIYYLHETQSFSLESDHDYDLAERHLRVQPDDTLDVWILYLCAAIAFLVPITGFIYLCCFRYCCGNSSPFSVRKKKAIKILIIATLLGTIIQIIIGILINNDRIHVG